VVGSGSGLLDVMFSIPNVGYNGLTSSHINPLRDYHVSTSPGLFPSVWCLEATVWCGCICYCVSDDPHLHLTQSLSPGD